MSCRWWYAPPLDIPFRCCIEGEHEWTHRKHNFRWTEDCAGAVKRRMRT